MEPPRETKALQNEKGKFPDTTTVPYQESHFFTWQVPNVKAFQQHFRPHDTDIIVATKPKSGTTWLKSLVYSIVHRTSFTSSNHPLVTRNSHELVPNFKFKIYTPERIKEEQLDLMMTSMTSTRLFSTHIPYDILPESIKVQSKCKIVYMARNPFDTVVSLWKFKAHINPQLVEQTSIEDLVETFCRGEETFGPHWNHVLGYWEESLERPNKVLFLKYEDLEDGVSELKKLAEFLGYGFSDEEERKGVIQEILRICSFETLKKLEVNKTGNSNPNFRNNAYFRKGAVGDWVNHLSPLMVERVDQVMRDKFAGFNLEFKMHS